MRTKFSPLLSLFIGQISLVLGLISVNVASASPWAGPGDRQLRFDIELLADYGVIDGPVTSWPIPWAQITRGISENNNQVWPVHVERAIARLMNKVPKRRDYKQFGLNADLRGTNSARVVRGFDGGARTDADARFSIDRHWSSTFVQLQVNVRDDPRDGTVQFDGSYVAQAVGNWIFYGGLVDQWYGPGFDGGLVLTNNARPTPKVGLMRLDPKPFKWRFLRWIGPWQLNVFASRLENDRNDFAHPYFMGIRFSMRPLKGLDIGFSRGLQLCGEGRPCGFSIWTDALIAFGDRDNTGTFDEPGNQLASIDFRYGRRVGKNTLSIYGELMGEDEDGFFIDEISILAGASLSGYSQSTDLTWRLGVEASDTFTDRLFFGSGDAGVTFFNGIFTDGYTYRGRTLAHSLDADSRLITLAGFVTDPNDREYFLRYRHVDINGESHPRHIISSNREKINIFEGGVKWPLKIGTIYAELRVMDDSPNTPGVSDFDVSFEAGFQVRF